MYKRTRYFLIALGFVTFLALAPAIILYVAGLRLGTGYDGKNYEQTGILVAQTNPKKAQVFLNNKLIDTTPATIRFLNPGEYSIKIHLDGYHDWSKSLEVKAGKVTWVNSDLNELKLIKQDTANQTIATGVNDFVIDGSRIIFLSDKNLVITTASDPDHSQNLALPKPVEKITALDESGLYLLRGGKNTLVFSLSTRQFFDISSVVDPETDIQISSDNTLLALQKTSLYQIDWQKHTKSLLLGNIVAYSVFDRDLYYIRADHGVNSLIVAPLSSLLENPGTILLANVPSAALAKIIVTPQKEVGLLLDHSFYRLNSQLERIADSVIDFDLNGGEDVLVLVRSGELDYYDFGADELRLVTRSGAGLSNARVHPADGYAFFASEGRLQALEIDSRDRQNDYTLQDNIKNASFFINDATDTIYLLNDGALSKLKIR